MIDRRLTGEARGDLVQDYPCWRSIPAGTGSLPAHTMGRKDSLNPDQPNGVTSLRRRNLESIDPVVAVDDVFIYLETVWLSLKPWSRSRALHALPCILARRVRPQKLGIPGVNIRALVRFIR